MGIKQRKQDSNCQSKIHSNTITGKNHWEKWRNINISIFKIKNENLTLKLFSLLLFLTVFRVK